MPASTFNTAPDIEFIRVVLELEGRGPPKGNLDGKVKRLSSACFRTMKCSRYLGFLDMFWRQDDFEYVPRTGASNRW